MLKGRKLQAAIVLSAGVVLGHRAASGDLRLDSPVGAAPQDGKAGAAKTAGVPGSPDATQTIDGRYLPNPSPKFGGVINPSAKDSIGLRRRSPPKGHPTFC